MKSRIRPVLRFIVLATVLVMASHSVPADAGGRTYTLDADFNGGVLFRVEHQTVHDQLQLASEVATLPFIWVPNLEGTVSKVDTVTGKELARYRVVPDSLFDHGSPSRTTVDLEGNCWVGCRQAGTVVKIGLYEAGCWIDRNHDGVCQTSQDQNGDGDITGAEILGWGNDECVLYEVVLVENHQGTYAPGAYQGPYDTDYWGTAPRGLAVDASNNLWVGTWYTQKYYYIDGSTCQILKTVDVSPWEHQAYGAVIDKNGILWSSGLWHNHVLRLDPSTNPPTISKVDYTYKVYGLGLDYLGHLFVSHWDQHSLSRINITTGVKDWEQVHLEMSDSRGVACTSDNNVWVANSGNSTVTRYDNNGILLQTVALPAGSVPTGVAVDAAGKVWVCDLGDDFIRRINPATNMVDLSKKIMGSGGHYSYSDMTGIVSSTITAQVGTWTVVFDSQEANTPWGKVFWTSYEPSGTSVAVTVRSSNDQMIWSPWESAGNGTSLGATPNGRYIQIKATLKITSGTVSPILYDLTAEYCCVCVTPTAPTSAAVDRNNLCADDSENISLSVTGGSGMQVGWYTGSCGGTPVGTGNPLSIASPTTTTTYHARWENVAPCTLAQSTCASVTVMVNPCVDIAQAKLKPNGDPVAINGKAVTAVFGDAFYVEEDHRACGIRVGKAGHGLAVGNRVYVDGTVQTESNKERYIEATTVLPSGDGSVAPVLVNNRGLGGGDWYYCSVTGAGQMGVQGDSGLNNIGLLVKTWGRYQQVDATTFTVDDGSGLSVRCTVPSGTFLYSGWQYVSVAGISSMFNYDSSIYLPNILVREIGVVLPVEVVSVPGTPSGNTGPVVNVSEAYTTSGSTCSQGHPVEYSFDWGDGTSSAWSTSTSASHSWSALGIKTVTVTARCQVSTVLTATSAVRTVNVVAEVVSVPGTPVGNTSPTLNFSYAYSTSGSTCNGGHPVEYSFNWSDGASSPWSTSTSASHSWSALGTKTVTVNARCQAHPIVSAISNALVVNVQDIQPGEMIFIPAGSFDMGTPDGYTGSHYEDEHPQHSVTLSGYYIGKYEVTRGEYQQFMNAGGYSNSAYWSTAGWSWKVDIGRTEPYYWAASQNWGSPPGAFTQTDNHPVVGVTYYEAEAFCNWAGGHLPTEAQWERAARWTGTHANVWPWDDTWNAQKSNNWSDSLYPGYQTAPVGSYSSYPSPSGCQDMAGNVGEWCQDWYGSTYYAESPTSDPQGPASGDYVYRVLRGGSWYGTGSYGSRCAFRGRYVSPGYKYYDGFRLAR